MTLYIYTLKCPETGEVRYVGKTKHLKHRLRQHVSEGVTRKIRSHKVNWINSVLRKGARPLFEIDTTVPEGADWKAVERDRIAYFRSIGCRLTNTTDGGDGATELTAEARCKLSARSRAFYADPVRRAEVSERSKALWADPAYRKQSIESLKLSCNRPEYVAALSERMKIYMGTPENKARQAAGMKARSENKEWTALRTAKAKATRSTPEYKARMSEQTKARWRDPEYRARIIAKRWDGGRQRARGARPARAGEAPLI